MIHLINTSREKPGLEKTGRVNKTGAQVNPHTIKAEDVRVPKIVTNPNNTSIRLKLD